MKKCLTLINDRLPPLRGGPGLIYRLDSPCLPGDVICACGANDRSGGLLAACLGMFFLGHFDKYLALLGFGA